VEPDAVEIRVVGCLIEKQRTTPDAYPLSLNALRLACNQSTNRDPVVAYEEAVVSEALRRLALRGWTRLASGAGSRARKYRHLMAEALGVDDAELALLGVLMLRGPQTPGELKQRGERLHAFDGLAAVQETLERLVARGYVGCHERRPGQKERRYEQLLGGLGEAAPSGGAMADARSGASGASAASGGAGGDPGPGETGGGGDESQPSGGDPPAEIGLAPAEDRLTRLERELAQLRSELASLREALGEGPGG
jgi:uncharacterized protein YceH (UPF0502 family)